MKIAAFVIGHAPRPDLAGPLVARLPDAEIIEIGALDGLTVEDLPDIGEAAYPLQTKLNSGETVYVSQRYVTEQLLLRLDEPNLADVSAGILLCAGTFDRLKRETLPLIKPFDVGRAMLQAIIATKIGIIAPFQAQEDPIRDRWLGAGFDPIVWTADVNQVDEAFEAEIEALHREHDFRAVVIDYVGHPESASINVQRIIPVPVIDLGLVAMDMLVASLK